jgi:hypothetical protein
MAANTEQLDRRAKAIEKELYKRAEGGSSCAELAAVLQEYAPLPLGAGDR